MIAAKLGTAVKLGKQSIYKQAQMPTDQAYDNTADVMVQNMLLQDTAKGIAAFKKSAPQIGANNAKQPTNCVQIVAKTTKIRRSEIG